MNRHTIQPRPDWQTKVESVGFHFHSLDEEPYWDESACYSFTGIEIATLEAATAEIHARCLDAVEHVLSKNLLPKLGIPPKFHDLVRQSWDNDNPTLYGRFDLAFDGVSPPKLLEYNADTPTSLLEAAVVQWHWLQDTRPEKDQFNSIHEKLIDAWKWFGQHVSTDWDFACVPDSLEDFLTVTYLRDTAQQAGLTTRQLNIDEIGYHWQRKEFVGTADDRPLRACFKLYPWEWMLREEFGEFLPTTATRWVEPPWKMILSNKAILPLLWELFPHHPNLLEASFTPLDGDCVRKPILSREGANIQFLRNRTVTLETPGAYGGPYIYQRQTDLPCFAGNYAVLGSWIIGDEPAGIGIREDRSPVTGNTSRFIPHFIE